MHRADTHACQHCNRQLWCETHVQRNAVPSPDPQRLQRIRQLADFLQKLLIGERAHLARLALPDHRGLRSARSGNVPVEAVVRKVDLPADKPLCPWQIPLKHLCPRLKPVQFSRNL